MDKLKLSAYEIIEVRKIADIESMGYILRHKKSGARVCVISNEDDNKVFSIGFRTPPEDETGVPHIIEHTTLCGSDKFPVKDPFIELAKGSLNTFLNAMTYPEKTLYTGSMLPEGVKCNKHLSPPAQISLPCFTMVLISTSFFNIRISFICLSSFRMM